MRHAGLVHDELAADHARVTAEVAPPRAMGQDDDRRGTHDVVLRAQGAAEHRPGAEELEIAAGYERPAEAEDTPAIADGH